MEMVEQIILRICTEAVSILIPAVIVKGIHECAKTMKAKTELIKEEHTRTFLETAINQTEYLAKTAVVAMEQTTAEELRDKVKDGQLSREELKQVAITVYNQIVTQLNPDYQEAIQGAYGDIQVYVTNLIEAKLYELKHTRYIKKE